MNEEQKRYIRERDKVCVYCSDSYGPWEIDHVRPRRWGGHDDPTNLVLACQRCNQLKGAQSVDNFLAKMAQVKAGTMKIVRLGGSYKRWSFKRI